MSRISLTDRAMAARVARTAHASVRARRIIAGREGMRVTIAERELRHFCSNDYLGLSQHPNVISAFQAAGARYGIGSAGSALISGHYAEHAALETECAEWMGYPRALLLGSGYLANLAVMQSLLGPGDVCVQDKLNHACLLDGARLSGCILKRYPHRDVAAARRQLLSHSNGAAMLASEGVFSMEGDLAPLPDLALVAREQQALFFVDDAHGIGVIGAEGRGSTALCHLGFEEVPLLLLPLGKAFGGQGALLLGSDALIGHIAETARPYLFTTAPPPAMAAAMRAALRLIRSESWRRDKLAALIARLRHGALQAGIPLQLSNTPIQPVLLGDNARTLAAAAALEAQGFFVSAIRPPTVPAGQARLRITLTTLHTEQEVDALVAALAMVCDNTAPLAL